MNLPFSTQPELVPGSAESPLGELLNRITDGIFAMDTQWRIVYGNDRAAEILGIRKEDYLGKTWFECFPGMEDSEFIEAYRGAMRTGRPVQFEAFFPPFQRWYSVNGYPSATGISVFFRDITAEKQAEEERELLAQIAHEAHNAVIICDTAMRIHWVNKAFVRMTGYAPEEVVGLEACSLLLHPESDRAMVDALFDALRAGQEFRTENLHLTKSRKAVWWEVFYKPVHNREGVITHFFAVASDISARRAANEKQKRYEEKVREQHETMLEVLEQMQDAFVTLSLDGKVLYWNEAATRITGVDRSAVLGQRLFSVFPQLQNSVFEQLFYQLLRSETPIHEEVYSPLSGRWLEVHAYTTQKGISVFFNNITERREKDKALHRLSLVAEQTSNIVAITDQDQKILWVNDAFTRITGYGFDEVVGRHNSAVFDGPGTDPALVEHVRTQVSRRAPFRIEVLNYKKDGSTYWADVTCQPVFNEQGELMFFFSIATDITEQKRLQQHLEAERRRHQQAVTMAAIKAQESERALVSRELHDNVNQVLTTVKLYTELCRDGIGDAKELTQKSLVLLQRCINEIRSLSKQLSAPSLGKIRLRESVVELAETVRATNQLQVDLDLEAIEMLEPVDQDVHLAVYRILQEQLTNILRHASATKVSIRFRRENDLMVLEVRDDGRGFDAAQKRSGIGITNMTTRAESVQGQLRIESAPGAGCLLSVAVPLTNAPAH